MRPEQSPVEEIQTPPAQTARRWRIPVLITAILVLALVVTAVVLRFDHDKFSAEPPACATLAPSLHLLGTAYTTQQDDHNNCNLLLPPDHPKYLPVPKITVSYYASTSGQDDAPDAEKLIRQLGAQGRPLPGVGDEAFIRDRDVFLRVSNLVVAIMVFPNPVSAEDQVRAFAADLANRLQHS